VEGLLRRSPFSFCRCVCSPRVFSFECDWLTFIIAGLQTLLMFRRPRHVIIQFIMREKTATLRSTLKYAFMKWCFSSVYMCVCSSRPEAEYYAKVFGWRPEKLSYVPFHTDPAFVNRERAPEESFVLSAGRTFRDYGTLLESFAESHVPLKIIAGRSSIRRDDIPPHITIQYDVPLSELIGLIARSMVVVLPLQDRQISVGQSVLLEAMAMGKPIVVTRVNGTIDYIEHLKTGILVPPGDPGAIRAAVHMLVADPALRRKLGEAARQRVLQEHLPNHYALGVSRVLSMAR
jgi:glycosyltransferase involved in cell wall biosynthesis